MRMRHKKNLESRWERAGERCVPGPSAFQGQWRASFCPEAEGVYAELGCGRGAFACAYAEREPQRLFVAAERVRDALVIGLERAALLKLPNLRFVAGDAYKLGEWFAPGELNGLYIHFCDPWPSRRHEQRRLCAGGFLDIYRPLLAGDALLRFKTDNAPLFDFARAELKRRGWKITEESFDLPRSEQNIETEYEQKFRSLGVPVCALAAMPQ